MKVLYTAKVHVTGGRDGRATADDGRLDVELALPAALGGQGNGTNPEQLFAAGYAGCFLASIRFAAGQMKLETGDVQADATILLGPHDDGRFGLKARIEAQVPRLAGEDLDRVIAEAKRICAYTNATHGNVETTFVVNGR